MKATSKDIRAFFKCSRIPDGGVYIVGGSLREAFIAFTTERDAELAMCHSGKILKGSKVTLRVSSMEELEKRLKLLLMKKKLPSTKVSVTRPRTYPLSALQPPEPADPEPSTASNDPTTLQTPCSPPPVTSDPQPSAMMDSSTAFLLGVCTVLGLQSSHPEARKASVSMVDKICNPVISNKVGKSKKTPRLNSGYVRLFGVPQSATKELICHFFKGLEVQEVIVNVKLGLSSGCLVKFASENEACRALLFNHHLLDSHPIEVRRASEKMWVSAVKECEVALGVGENHKTEKSTPERSVGCTPKPAAPQKRQRVEQLEHDSPRQQRPDGESPASSPNREYVVMVKYLPRTITKTEIKELLGCPNVVHENVLHLLDKEGNRTDTAFVLFNCVEDYKYAINLTGCHVGSNVIEVSSTTRVMMRDTMAKARPWRAEHHRSNASLNRAADPTALTCLFMRNMPAGVKEGQIKSLLYKHRLSKSSVTLLTDRSGKGIGEAVVRFKSEKLAALAQRLHGQEFLGSQLILTCISVKQMEDILANI